jgi:hypothetical protein
MFKERHGKNYGPDTTVQNQHNGSRSGKLALLIMVIKQIMDFFWHLYKLTEGGAPLLNTHRFHWTFVGASRGQPQ